MVEVFQKGAATQFDFALHLPFVSCFLPVPPIPKWSGTRLPPRPRNHGSQCMFTLPIDQIHSWESTAEGLFSTCRIRVWAQPDLECLVCMMTEIRDNPGETITAGMGKLVESLVDDSNGWLDYHHTYWVEHYVAVPGGNRWDMFHRVQYSPWHPPVFTPVSLRFMSTIVDSCPIRIPLQGDQCGIGSKRRPGGAVRLTGSLELEGIIRKDWQEFPESLTG